jgi:hypothetical protein
MIRSLPSKVNSIYRPCGAVIFTMLPRMPPVRVSVIVLPKRSRMLSSNPSSGNLYTPGRLNGIGLDCSTSTSEHRLTLWTFKYVEERHLTSATQESQCQEPSSPTHAL